MRARHAERTALFQSQPPARAKIFAAFGARRITNDLEDDDVGLLGIRFRSHHEQIVQGMKGTRLPNESGVQLRRTP